MKKLTTVLLAILCVFASCQKQSVADTALVENTSLTSRNLDFRNPDPTWIQITSPILRPAKWSGYVLPGFSAGLPGPYSSAFFQIYDSSIIYKWHLHVGLRYFNGKWKPDVIDYYHYNINALYYYQKPIPNGGVQGDYDFVDTVKIQRWGWYNWMFTPQTGYDSTYLNYDWNGANPEIHSKATNGWLDDPLITKYLR
jgi:hypothetical protein